MCVKCFHVDINGQVCFVNYIPLPITDLADVFAVFDKVDCIKASDVRQVHFYCADVFVDKKQTLFHMTLTTLMTYCPLSFHRRNSFMGLLKPLHPYFVSWKLTVILRRKVL